MKGKKKVLTPFGKGYEQGAKQVHKQWQETNEYDRSREGQPLVPPLAMKKGKMMAMKDAKRKKMEKKYS
nr:MAG: hypothetical protein [Podoviridae sp. ctka020]